MVKWIKTPPQKIIGMLSSLIEIAVGYFVYNHVPGMVKATGLLETIIRLVGVIILIGGFVSLVKHVI